VKRARGLLSRAEYMLISCMGKCEFPCLSSMEICEVELSNRGNGGRVLLTVVQLLRAEEGPTLSLG
jgi:hypothetical protein